MIDKNTCIIPPTDCRDCMDLHFKNIAHDCHCHAKSEELPNLSSMIDQPITGIFYMRDSNDKKAKVLGVRIMTKGNMVTIRIAGDELDIEYARSL
jgi:hypothetical protein